MTGLDAEIDSILSIACYITNSDLSFRENEGFHSIIHFPSSRHAEMKSVPYQMHVKSGLLTLCNESQTRAEEAADNLLRYVRSFVPEPRSALLAGNTVHADATFLRKEPWSKVLDHLHYRILDISSLKEAARRWASSERLNATPKKEGKHEAKADILESIAEARYYRDTFFAA